MISDFDTAALNPVDPKSVIDALKVQNRGRNKTHSQLYKRIAKDVFSKDCAVDSFNSLLQRIQIWYPVEHQ